MWGILVAITSIPAAAHSFRPARSHLQRVPSTIAEGSRCFSQEELARSTWRPGNRSGSAANVCIQGKLVPELYLLGSSFGVNPFAVNMMAAGVECAGATRRVAADFTAKHMSLVPKPNGTLKGGLIARFPWVLATMYGVKGKHINFVVMLRDPVASMYIRWQHNDSHVDFQQWAADEVDNMTPTVWAGMFGYQMSLWTHIFRDDQFYMVPHQLFNQSSSEQICNDISQRLNLAIVCGQVQRTDLPHPSSETLREMLGAQLQDSTFWPDEQLLLDNLQRGSKSGMGLAAYAGKPSDRWDIRHWLEAHW